LGRDVLVSPVETGQLTRSDHRLESPVRTVARSEVDHLVESVSGNSLRLNAPGPVIVVAARAKEVVS
jgi:hypothetical protein